MIPDVVESSIDIDISNPVVTEIRVEMERDVNDAVNDDRDIEAPLFRQELIVPVKNHSTIAGKKNIDVAQLQPQQAHQLSTSTLKNRMEELGDDHTSGTIASTTTSTTTTTTSSKNSSNTTPLPVPDDSVLLTHPEVEDERRRKVHPTRKLFVQSKHILHLRSQEIQAIVQSYQHYQPPPPLAANSGGDVVTTHPYATTTSLIRDSSHTSSITSHDGTSASCSMTPTFLIVTGPTGSGKTKLLQAAFEDLVVVKSKYHSNNGYYIRGTFDLLRHPDPYRVFTLALTDFTSQVLARSTNTPDILFSMRHAIMDACGDEVHVLIQMIPSLSAIISNAQIKLPGETSDGIDNITSARSLLPATAAIDTNPSSPPVQQDDATQRFVFVFQKFLRSICSVVASIVLVLEDMQYADDCSIDVLCSTLTDLHQIPGLFVAATYNGSDINIINDDSKCVKDGEEPLESNSDQVGPVSTTNPSYFVESILKMKRCHLSDGSIHIQTIAIDNFDEEQVQYLLSQTLQQCAHFDLQVDETFHSLVMKQTSGNLYRIIEFLNWLEDHQLLTTNCPPNCNNVYTYWKWNIDDIRRAVNDQMLLSEKATEQKSNTQPFYTSTVLKKLSLDVIEVLKVGACFGSSRMDEMLMEYVLDYPIHIFVAEAVEMGILICLHESKDGKQYAFSHENVQSLVHHLIPENDRELFHLEIGRRLWRRIDRDELDRNIFVVLSQIWMGRRLVTRLSERYKIAALCLHAGRKAAKSSSFRISLLYLKFGIELLGDRGWRDEYDLSLMLYNATAEMEVCNANFEGMELLVTEILHNSRNADDTIQARTTQVYAFGVSDRQQEGLTLGIQLMSDLGYAFPVHFCLWTLRSEMKTVLSLLKGKSNDYIKRLPVIEDAKVLAAMHVLNMVSACFCLYVCKYPHCSYHLSNGRHVIFRCFYTHFWFDHGCLLLSR